MKDERYRAEAVGPRPDPNIHKELQIMRHMERIGTLIKNGLLDSDVVLDFAGFAVRICWDKLEPVCLAQCESTGERPLWENFEFMAREAQLFSARAPASAQPRVPRERSET